MEGFEQQERYPWEENIAVPEGGADPEGAAPADYAYGEVEEPDAGQQNMYEGGNADDGWYRAYQKPPKQKKEGGGFGVKLLKCAALAVVFGLLAGSSFVGTTHFFGKVTGRDAAPEEEAAPSGADLSIAAEPEAVGQLSAGQKTGDSAPQKTGAVADVSGIVRQSMPSIVSITTIARMQAPGFFFGRGQEYESEGCGSGIVISQDEENLYIATNNHVIAGAQTLTVFFSDETAVDAQVRGTDASSDLAVVSVALNDIEDETKEEIRVATFGDSDQLKIGQTAIAIGNALGYGQSVTTGVISALDREVTVTNESDGSTITNDLVQTSAAINPGNSGGALLNAKGEVIGITSVKYSETEVEGMGYAIPSDTAIPIIRQLITREVVRGSDSSYLGISGVDVTQNVSDTYNMSQGVYVTRVVEGSSAEEAGILQGDIITRFDGRNVKSMDEMMELMQYLPAGSVVEVEISRARNGEYEEHVLEVTLGSKN